MRTKRQKIQDKRFFEQRTAYFSNDTKKESRYCERCKRLQVLGLTCDSTGTCSLCGHQNTTQPPYIFAD